MRHTLPLMLLCLTGLDALGQIEQPLRYERPQKSTEEYFMVYGLKQDGIALFRDTEHPKEGKAIWELIVLDSMLRERVNTTVAVSLRLQIEGYDHTPGQFHLLFRETQDPRGDMEVITVDLADGRLSHYEIKPQLELKLTHFNKVGESFVFGGYVDTEPTIILYPAVTGQLKVLPGFIQKDVELVDLRVNANATFNVVLVDRPSKPFRKVVFKTFDETGRELLEDQAEIGEERTIQSGLTSQLVREDLFLTGTWGSKNSKQSQGFYAMPVNPFDDQPIKYLYTGDLEHFLDYLNPSRAERIKTKTQKAVQDKRVPDFGNNIAPFELVETSDGFVLLAEMYIASSTPDPVGPYGYPYTGYYGYGLNSFYGPFNRFYRPYPYSRDNGPKTNVEIKTQEIAVIAFDPKGNVIWDASFECGEIKSPYLRQTGAFCSTRERVVMLYKDEKELHVKYMDLNNGHMTDSTCTIETGVASDDIRSEKELEGGIRRWYNSNLFIWGYQTIRNTTMSDRIREVFYVNKVVVR